MVKLGKEEVAKQADEFVNSLFKKIQLDLETETHVNHEGVSIQISGADSNAILADNARLLYSVNHLVNQIYYRQSIDKINFFMDCENYREDRAAELKLMARKAAEQVRVSRSKVSLQPMPSSERRIIHLALADEKRVRTESEGSGRYRRVLIVPDRD